MRACTYAKTRGCSVHSDGRVLPLYKKSRYHDLPVGVEEMIACAWHQSQHWAAREMSKGEWVPPC